MSIKAKRNDAESRSFWENVERGARRYDEMPEWKRGKLGGVADSSRQEDADDSRAEPRAVPDDRSTR